MCTSAPRPAYCSPSSTPQRTACPTCSPCRPPQPLILLGVAALLPGPDGSWTSGLLSSLILAAGYLTLFLISRGFGFGDVKLALVLGAVLGWYGWPIVLIGTFAAYLLGALYGIGLLVAGRAGRDTRIPFGPFLLAGALAGMLLGALT
ncbi:prepilin peptidase [Streptomyces chartreusis]|uniref:prepilin peptidase n=1 Tax=Streptomyces chartreusis TaxID=1969 RepID=UPI0037FF8908